MPTNTSSGHISLYPNPVTNELNIEINNTSNDIMQFTVSDIIGKELYRSNKTVTKGISQHQITTSNLTDGLYLLNIKSEEGLKSYKFTVQR